MLADIAKKNADILWNEPNAILTCNDNGELSTISSWNLLGRLINWWSDRKGEITSKINSAVKDTFDTIHTMNEQKKLVYVRNRDSSAWFFDPARFYSKHYPADLLANGIKEHPRFKTDASIIAAATKVSGDKGLYPQVKPPHSLMPPLPHTPVESDLRILDWDNGPRI